MDPARRPSHHQPPAWGLIKALTESWPWHRHPMETHRVGQREKVSSLSILGPVMSCPHPSPGQGRNCKEQFPFLCKTPGIGAIICPMGWRSTVDAKQALRGPTSTCHKRQETGIFLMALITSKSGLPWVAIIWGMKSCHHPLLHSLRREERQEGACPPHRCMVSLAQLSRRNTCVLVPLWSYFKARIALSLSWKTNLPGHVGSAGDSEDAK